MALRCAHHREMRLIWAFDQAEGIRASREALRLARI
jgi:hypothetical protein